MFFIKNKKSRQKLENEVRSFMDLSDWTREEMEENLESLIPEIDLSIFSDEEIEGLLRSNYDFSEYTTRELKDLISKHKRFKDYSREDLEEALEEAVNDRFYAIMKIAKDCIIAIVIITTIIAFLNMRNFDSRIQKLEEQNQLLTETVIVLADENAQIKEEMTSLADLIEVIIWYISNTPIYML